METMIVLKKYISREDYETIGKLEKVCINNDKVNLKLELDYKLNRHRDNGDINDINELLYYIDGRLIAYMGICSFSGNTAELNGIVHPDFRRMAIFRRLLNIALTECRRRSFDKVLLLSDDNSISGIEFIKSVEGSYSFSEYNMSLKENNRYYGSSSITLIKARNKDSEIINNLNRLAFGDIGKDKVFPEEEEKYGAVTYLVKLEDITMGKIKVDYDNNSAFISGFSILPEYRGKGLGRQALQKVIELVSENGIENISLDVACENNRALSLYRSCGFIEKSVMNYYVI